MNKSENKTDDELLVNLRKKVEYQSNSRRVKELFIFAEDGTMINLIHLIYIQFFK